MKKEPIEMTIPFEVKQVDEKNVKAVVDAVESTSQESSNDPVNILNQLIEERDREAEKRQRNSKKKAEEYRIKHGAEAYERLFSSDRAPEEPKRRPHFIRDITEPAPQHVRTAAGNFLLPAFAIYATDVNFPYNDNSLKEPRENSFVVGKNGIGKGNVKPMLEAVLSQVELLDEEGWKADKEYRQEKEEMAGLRSVLR